ncbi:MAG: PHB depolymerase family esterase, partial [Pseudomonadota bacterium]
MLEGVRYRRTNGARSRVFCQGERGFSTLALLVLSTLLLAGEPQALAEGSGGQGGPLGQRDDWPCPGCIMLAPPGYSSAKPMPLLVVLHGDEGRAGDLYWLWKPYCEEAGFLLFAPKCPEEEGCNGRWSRWYRGLASGPHNPEWLGRQIDRVEQEYNVDRSRMYLAGRSGGSFYLGFYAIANAGRFAAVSYASGGQPFLKTCPACKIPAYFLIGERDEWFENATWLRDLYDSCGHEYVWDARPGAHHSISPQLRETAPRILEWFLEHPLACSSNPGSGDPPDGGSSPALYEENSGGCTMAGVPGRKSQPGAASLGVAAVATAAIAVAMAMIAAAASS